eukprot:CAMPEP_0170497168 /NCGR_PEP_ID=MMETSP0208-20121228/23929_1 /TAXON_ID=197538 /ORGANISM="Strombidium inclinatum, Strain S3" /LENGTH=131 /DNA_ID=CAMNT_0010773901 /DNA_START=646 /DNA_END=1041 /DNA_ORIENTATION=-
MTQPNIFPEIELGADDLTDSELQPHFFTPDFLRPLPVPEGQDIADEEDFDDAYWLVPGLCPEPTWDIHMGQEASFHQIKNLFQKALKQSLTEKEVETFLKVLFQDEDIVHQLGMTPNKLGPLINNNRIIAS